MFKLRKLLPLILPFSVLAASGVGAFATEQSTPRPYGFEDMNIEYYDVTGEEKSPSRPFDDSTKYDYSNLSLTDKKGSHTLSSGTYTSSADESLSVFENVPYPYGTYSVDFKTVDNTDSGIIFGVSDNEESSYWESGVSYYWFYISTLDTTRYIRLVAIYDGIYTELVSKSFTVNLSSTYKLKVVMISNKIICYADSTMICALKDDDFIEGTKFGFRSSKSGVTYSNISVTNDYLYEE